MSTHAHAAGHDEHEGHHGHVIVPVFTLRAILGALLFFTLLTVGLSKGEAWLADTFNFDIPQWVNVVVAMSIAVVKTVLVVMFFMQLKYDSPLNSMIFIFTILTVTFFLGFTMIDLGKRQTLDRFKGEYISPGGTGGMGLHFQGPIVQYSKTKAALEGSGHGHHDDAHAFHVREPRGTFANAGYRAPVPAKGSTADRARPVTGLTLSGFAPAVGEDGHAEPHEGDAHGDAPAGEHADEKKPAAGH